MIIHVLRREIKSILKDDISGGDAENSMRNIVAEFKVVNIGNNLGYFVIVEKAAGLLKVCFKSIDIRSISIGVSGRKTI